LTEALICHLGFVRRRPPVRDPTIHARDGDHSVRPRLAWKSDAEDGDGSHRHLVTVTLLDGLVLARSV